MLVRPNNSSILLSNPRCIVKLEKTDNCLSEVNFYGEAGAVPRKATGEVLPEVCFLRYSDIFGDDSGFEFAKYQQVLISCKTVL
jgi:hypothetical protein